MKDRIVFKEALNECSSPERTALLYLEDLIIDVRKSIPVVPEVSESQEIDLSPLYKRMDAVEYDTQKWIKKLKAMDVEKRIEILKKWEKRIQENIKVMNNNLKLAEKISAQIQNNIAKANQKDLSSSFVVKGDEKIPDYISNDERVD